MRKKNATILLILVFAVGLSLLLYPTVSNYWNSLHATRVVASYDNLVSTISNQDYTAMIEAANAYNQTLLAKPNRFLEGDEKDPLYRSLLRIEGSDVLGYVEIPKINVKLPIYHGTDEAVLQVGVGHLVGSSLPVGGESTHSALSGHTGLPSAKLLTDMDQLVIDDMFYLHIFGAALAYQVDQIEIVEPENIEPLEIVPGEDYVTLVTCTPYGINSHRLLVRGRRVFPEEAPVRIVLSSDGEYVAWWQPVALFAAPVFLLGLIPYLIFRKRK